MMPVDWPFIAEKVATRLTLAEQSIARRKAALPPWRLQELDSARVDIEIVQAPVANQSASQSASQSDWTTKSSIIEPESYWGRADLNFILRSQLTVPPHWRAEHLALHLPLGVLGDIFNHPEALVYVDDTPIGSADRYHHTLTLPEALADGQPHQLTLHGWTGHAGWPIDPDSKTRLFMGCCSLIERDPNLLAFITQARAVLDTQSVLVDDSTTRRQLLHALNEAIKALDTRQPGSDDFYASVPEAHACLARGVRSAGKALEVTLHAIGHAHMDVAYLWPVAQIRLKNARTYANVLRLMDSNPDYRFSHSQPQLYAMTAEDYPQLFEQIKRRVSEGRWEIMGGMWVEPDLNIPGAEALVRQLTLGREYFRREFGDVETPVLWLPDTFGFPGQIPQLMRKAGLKWFATNKLNWNQYNRVEHSSHHWCGIDGSRVLAHILTTPRSVQYLPFPTNYKSDLSAAEVMGTWTHSTCQQSVQHLPVCYGYGDGGGGPTEQLLATAQAYRSMPGMPQVKMSTVREAFEHIEAVADTLSTWTGEHYMEGHRGVYTSQGWIKRANRKAEWALHEAEALCVMAGKTANLEQAWKLLCLNQFHDIVTGTSVTQVFVDARNDFNTISSLTESVTASACACLASDTTLLANTCPVTTTRVALIEEASELPGQRVAGGTLACYPNLPAYSLTPVTRAQQPPTPVQCHAIDTGARFENRFVVIELLFDGGLTRVYDKLTGREVIAEDQTGNQLLAFEDRPICWDAWDIDADYEDRQDILDGYNHFEIVESGPIRASVRITKSWRSSTLTQIIRLHAHSSRLDFETTVDWHESHTLLKAAFPTTVQAETARFDIQWGFIERSTQRESTFDAARFEVPAHQWACVTDATQGAALLNDCKYGYDVRGGTLRLSLIKSSTSPDPQADQGEHVFTYAFAPFAPSKSAALDAMAYDLNAPLRVLTANATEPSTRNHAAFVSSSAAAVIIETLKPASDGNGCILRMYLNDTTATTTTLTFTSAIARAERCNFQEQCTETLSCQGAQLDLHLSQFEIVSLRILLSPHQGRARA